MSDAGRILRRELLVHIDGACEKASYAVLDDALTVIVVEGEPRTLALVGGLDFRTTRKVTTAAHALATHDLVIDCSDLTFLDSLGVSALVRMHQDRQAVGARLVLTGLTGSPRRVLEMMALLDMFEGK